RLDSTVRVYANLATMLNDKNANLVPWKEGRSNTVSGETDENATALSLGFRYDF
ncbi:porin, partial [Acinetobacter schindleri]